MVFKAVYLSGYDGCRVAFETFVSFSLGFEMCLLTHSLQEILEGILYLYNLEMKRKYKKESVKKVKVYTTYTK